MTINNNNSNNNIFIIIIIINLNILISPFLYYNIIFISLPS